MDLKIPFCVLILFIDSNVSEDNYLKGLDWNSKKVALDFRLYFKDILARFNAQNSLGFGDKCSVSNEKKRLEIAHSVFPDVYAYENDPNVDKFALVPKLTVKFQKLETLDGEFCNWTRKLGCPASGICECLRDPALQLDLIQDGQYCRIPPGSPCPMIDNFAAGKFLPKHKLRRLDPDVESKKCAYEKTCIIKEDGRMCTRRNIGRTFKKILRDSIYDYDEERGQILSLELNAEIKRKGYCICEGTSLAKANLDVLKYLVILMIILIYSEFFRIVGI